MHLAGLRIFIEDAPIGAAMFDREMRYLAYSRYWLVNHRIEHIELGRSHCDVFPEIPERWKEVHGRALAGETIREAEDEFRRADGSAIWLKWETRPWRDANGAIGGVIIFCDDITPQKEAEEALRQALARQRLAQSAGHIGVWDWEIAPNRTYLNAEWYEIYGLPKGSVLAYEDFIARVHPDDRSAAEKMMQDALAGEGIIDHDYRVVRADDGAMRWVASKGEVYFDARGKAERAMGAVYDITERKEMEDALRESDRRKSEFLATLAHELRSPLTPISNAVDVLGQLSDRDASPAGEKKRAVLQMARRQVDHLSRLVNDLLDVMRIDHGKISLDRSESDLVQLLVHAVELAQPNFDSKRHALVTDLPATPLPINGDPVRLTQVFANLLNNAARYTDPDGRIELSARREGDEAVVTVRDNGQGIAPEMLVSIFEMFAQAGDPASQRGLGVGLALARSLVDLHGGTIEARSEGVGRGSEFIVRLPAPRIAVRAPLA
ncbi:PAS domain-containing sensor histidine kinase [Methylocystis parvus]|uniref:sensor histidine kinase n=1 Tax=Methylocystis parvus TaxID=134 RepID=UPI003C74FFAD